MFAQFSPFGGGPVWTRNFPQCPGCILLKSESSIHRLNIYEDVNNEMSLFQQKNNVTKNSSADSGAKEAVVSIQRGHKHRRQHQQQLQ